MHYVYKAFDCNTFSDCSEIYQNCDAVLLAEVFTSFPRTAMNYYSLVQLFRDINDYIWVESQMRGSICFLGKRCVTANDPHIPETYNPDKENSYIIALDANNFYGFVMVQPLPYGHFLWFTQSEIENFTILETTPNSPVRYLLEILRLSKGITYDT